MITAHIIPQVLDGLLQTALWFGVFFYRAEFGLERARTRAAQAECAALRAKNAEQHAAGKNLLLAIAVLQDHIEAGRGTPTRQFLAQIETLELMNRHTR